MESVPITDDYLIASNLGSLEHNLLKDALIKFSIEHLLQKKIVTRNFKTGYNFTNSFYNGTKEVKRFTRLLNKLVKARHPYIMDDRFIDTYNGSLFSIVFRNVAIERFNRRDLLNRYLYKIQAALEELGFTGCRLSIQPHNANRSTRNGEWFTPIAITMSYQRSTQNLVSIYKLIWNIDEVIKVLSNINRIMVEYDLSRISQEQPTAN